MKRILRIGHREFEIRDGRDLRTDGRPMCFPDRAAAALFLRGFLQDPISLLNLREFVRQHFLLYGLERMSDHEQSERLAWELVAGRAVVLELPRRAHVAIRGEKPEPVKAKPAEKPVEEEDVLELFFEDGEEEVDLQFETVEEEIELEFGAGDVEEDELEFGSEEEESELEFDDEAGEGEPEPAGAGAGDSG